MVSTRIGLSLSIFMRMAPYTTQNFLRRRSDADHQRGRHGIAHYCIWTNSSAVPATGVSTISNSGFFNRNVRVGKYKPANPTWRSRKGHIYQRKRHYDRPKLASQQWPIGPD